MTSLSEMPTIRSVMTEFVYSTDIDAPVSEAIAFMRKAGIRHLPVTENGELKGIVADRDIKLMLGPDFDYPEAEKLLVREAMAPESYVVDAEAALDEVLDHMARHRIGSALVTSNGELAGIFTSTDACRAFAEFLRGRPDVTGH